MFFFDFFPDLFFFFFLIFSNLIIMYLDAVLLIFICLGFTECVGSLYLYLINFGKMSAIISPHIFPGTFRVKVTKRRKRKSEVVLAILYMLI